MNDEPEFAPKCIWCSAPWSDENIKMEIMGAYSYESCSDPGHPRLQIICHECGKLMYEKSGEYIYGD